MIVCIETSNQNVDLGSKKRCNPLLEIGEEVTLVNCDKGSTLFKRHLEERVHACTWEASPCMRVQARVSRCLWMLEHKHSFPRNECPLDELNEF